MSSTSHSNPQQPPSPLDGPATLPRHPSSSTSPTQRPTSSSPSFSYPAPRPRRGSSITNMPPLLMRTSSATSGSPTLPTRHPRQMTPAELHLELEQEQEALVNRLSRDLAVLRSHAASISSNGSLSGTSSSQHPAGQQQHSSHHGVHNALSGSAILDPGEPLTLPHWTPGGTGGGVGGSREAAFPLLSGPTHPTPRRERSSSSVSGRSVASSISLSGPAGIGGGGAGVAGERERGVVGLGGSGATNAVAGTGATTSQAGVDRARDALGIGIAGGPAAGVGVGGGGAAAGGTREGDAGALRSRGNSSVLSGGAATAAAAVQSGPPTGRTGTRRVALDSELEGAVKELGQARAENERLVSKVWELERSLKALKDGAPEG